MSGYILGFTVYTLAIIGVILLAFVVAKKSMLTCNIAKKKEFFLDIEHSVNIAPRKTVQVLRAGNERFLIALDTERTTFLTKLAIKNEIPQEEIMYDNTKKLNPNEQVAVNTSIMRSVLEKLNT
jgi:flagellar biogenesis protein FliO